MAGPVILQFVARCCWLENTTLPDIVPLCMVPGGMSVIPLEPAKRVRQVADAETAEHGTLERAMIMGASWCLVMPTTTAATPPATAPIPIHSSFLAVEEDWLCATALNGSRTSTSAIRNFIAAEIIRSVGARGVGKDFIYGTANKN